MATADSSNPVIVLNDEQLRIVINASRPIEVRDSQGHLISQITLPEDDIAVAKRRLRSNGRRFTAEQVESILASLTIAAERDGLSREQLHELYLQLRDGAST